MDVQQKIVIKRGRNSMLMLRANPIAKP